MVRAVSRWQLFGLALNDVIGSGIYLLPAAAAALLGPSSLWAVLLAGLAVSLLVLCYAQASSYFDDPGGGYLYAREAFGSFIGFEVGWMLFLTRIASAAALSNGLAEAVTHFWPSAASGAVRIAIVVGSLAFLVGVNVVGVRAAARTGVFLAIAKLVPLLMFIGIGAMFVDTAMAAPLAAGSVFDLPLGDLGQAALLLLFAYAGFENLPAAAGEYRNPRRDVPFALLAMIATVTAVYFAVQWVALGTLPGLADSATPLADAAARFGGGWLALVLTVGATVSILGTNSNTIMLGPRYLHALAMDGYGPRALASIHPRFRTPAVAILTLGGFSLVLALSGSFVQLALLSVVARLFTYIGTAVSVLVLRKRYGNQPGAMQLPGGPLIPVVALLLSIGLLASAKVENLVAGAVALLAMIATVTAVYFAVQWVALGTLPGLADSATPLADAAARFGGGWLALVLTVGATVSILGTNSNTIMLGPRYLHALAMDGYGPRALASIHPRFRTPAVAILTLGGFSLVLALSGSFVQLALLSVVARLFTYIGTAVSVLVLRKRYGNQPGAMQLPGGPLIPVVALLLSIGLLASAKVENLVAGAVALLIGAVIYRFRRKPVAAADPLRR